VLHLEQRHESDENILALAAEEAQLVKELGPNVSPEILDRLLAEDVLVSVNVGIGATDPAQRLGQLRAAVEMTGMVFGPEIRAKVNSEDMIAEIWGRAGFKDGKRFFKLDENGGMQAPDPEKQQMMEAIQQMQALLQEAQKKLQDKSAELETKREIAAEETQSKEQIAAGQQRVDFNVAVAKIRAEKEAEIEIARIRAEAEVEAAYANAQAQVKAAEATALAAPAKDAGEESRSEEKPKGPRRLTIHRAGKPPATVEVS
jgi:hypothetical protein